MYSSFQSENQRTLLRPLRSQTWHILLKRRVDVHFSVHGEVHVCLERSQQDIRGTATTGPGSWTRLDHLLIGLSHQCFNNYMPRTGRKMHVWSAFWARIFWSHALRQRFQCCRVQNGLAEAERGWIVQGGGVSWVSGLRIVHLRFQIAPLKSDQCIY